MATLDEYISTFYSNIQTDIGPQGYPTVFREPIPPASFVENDKVVRVIQRSTISGEQELIPVTVPTGSETRTVIKSTEVPRTEESVLERLVNANIIQSEESVLSTDNSKTFFDAREEAISVEINRPVQRTEFAAVKSQDSPDSTDLIRTVDLQLIQIIQPQSTDAIDFSTPQSIQDEISPSTELQSSVAQVSQIVSQDAVLLTQQFALQLIAERAEANLERSITLTRGLSAEEQIAERFNFDPNTSLFSSPDLIFQSFQQASTAASAAQAVVDSGGDSTPETVFDGGGSFDFGGGGG